MRTLTIDGHSIQVPYWNEWTKEQLLNVSELAGMELPIDEFCLKALFLLTGLKVWKKREKFINVEACYYVRHGKDNVYLIGERDLTYMTMSIRDNFFKKILQKGEESYIFDSQLFENKIVGFLHDHVYYYGPQKGLANLIFEEYIYSETYFDRYSSSKENKYLDKLIAVLYRPQKEVDEMNPEYDGDKREKFNAHLIEARAKELASLSDKYKTAIFFYYSGCRYFLSKQFPEVFKEGDGGGTDIFQNFIELTSALSGGSINNEKLRKTMLYDVLSDLNTRKKHQKELEKKQKENKYGRRI